MLNFKKDLTREEAMRFLSFFAKLNLGLILTALGTELFKTPNHFAFGGTTGLSILLADIFPRMNVGGFMWIINTVLVVLGFIFLGVRKMGWTIYSSYALSFYISVFELLFPLDAPLTSDTLLELLFAVFLPAVGSAIVFDIGASTGGTDIIALILTKYTSMEIGKALGVSDLLVVIGAALRFGAATGLYCIVGLACKAFVVDSVIESINLRKVCTVVCSHPEQVEQFIIHQLHRSATIEKATGAYTQHELTVLMTVLTRREAVQLRNFLRANEPGAFITIVNSSEIIGKGFRSVA